MPANDSILDLAKLKETDDVFWFSDGRESGEGKYIGRCCLERHIT